MTSEDINKISNIVVDMLMEFQKEQNRLQALYDNGSARLAEIDENISNYKETEDVDFKVFSPRNISTLNEDKLLSMDKEKNDISESNKAILRQLKYYNEKVNNLMLIQSIIEGENIVEPEVVDIDEEVDDVVSKYFKKNIVKDGIVSDPEEVIVKEEKVSAFETKELSVDNDIPTTNNGLDEYQLNSLTDNLSRLSHRLDTSYRVIDIDVYRTKLELKSMKSSIDDIIKSLK